MNSAKTNPTPASLAALYISRVMINVDSKLDDENEGKEAREKKREQERKDLSAIWKNYEVAYNKVDAISRKVDILKSNDLADELKSIMLLQEELDKTAKKTFKDLTDWGNILTSAKPPKSELLKFESKADEMFAKFANLRKLQSDVEAKISAVNNVNNRLNQTNALQSELNIISIPDVKEAIDYKQIISKKVGIARMALTYGLDRYNGIIEKKKALDLYIANFEDLKQSRKTVAGIRAQMAKQKTRSTTADLLSRPEIKAASPQTEKKATAKPDSGKPVASSSSAANANASQNQMRFIGKPATPTTTVTIPAPSAPPVPTHSI